MAKTVFIKRNNAEYGPFEFDEAQELLRNGGILADDLMKTEGNTTWTLAGTFLKSFGLRVAGTTAAGALMTAVGGNTQAAVADSVSDTAQSAGQWVQVDSYDFDGDGVSDVDLYDFDGDGIADMQVYDLNGDGIADVAEIDIDGDGIIDGVMGFFSGLFE